MLSTAKRDPLDWEVKIKNKIPKRIRIAEGPTVVWKKDKQGKLKPTIVKRRAYVKTIWVNKQ